VHLQLSPVNYAPNFFSTLGAHVHPVHTWATPMVTNQSCIHCTVDYTPNSVGVARGTKGLNPVKFVTGDQRRPFPRTFSALDCLLFWHAIFTM